MLRRFQEKGSDKEWGGPSDNKWYRGRIYFASNFATCQSAKELLLKIYLCLNVFVLEGGSDSAGLTCLTMTCWNKPLKKKKRAAIETYWNLLSFFLGSLCLGALCLFRSLTDPIKWKFSCSLKLWTKSIPLQFRLEQLFLKRLVPYSCLS